MRRVFFENKVIIFTDSDMDNVDFIVDTNHRIDNTKVLQKLENSKQVVIKAIDEEQIHMEFCEFMNPLEAAGGLVENSKGEYLMIYRNERWDLPKGHVEMFESFAECAVREVEEECGVMGLSITEKLIITQHIYRWDSKWMLKDSHWFKMSIDPQYEDMATVPQTEEGIIRAEWIGKDELCEKLSDGYITIQEVFKAAGII